MSYYRRPSWNENGFDHYKIRNRRRSRVVKEEHKRRVRDRIDVEDLPKTWEEFKLLSAEEQERMAKILSVVVQLFDYARTDFIQGVIQEYEWILSSYWLFVCKDCGFPDEFCASL
jgi:hypothetical protein